MTGPSRGFFGRARVSRDPRLPPGQHDIGREFPVLTAEVTPDIEPATWTFRIDGLVQSPRTWTWDELHAMPESIFEGDIHCVTTWSKLDTSFSGLSLDPLLAQPAPLPVAAYAIATSTGHRGASMIRTGGGEPTVDETRPLSLAGATWKEYEVRKRAGTQAWYPRVTTGS
jgi:DMSO/TMAO reductase YedYZ molybdopterin-dependent catalytic subunit